jgi:hypothetical protein
MTKPLETTGGCLCGALRYAAHGDPIDAGYCHCRTCQRSSGAPVLAWAAFPNGAFAYTKGSPATYRSSSRAAREFCGACGTQIAFREDGATRVDLNIGSLDHPSSIAPEYHIWTESRIPWFETVDELPRYPDAGPDGEES